MIPAAGGKPRNVTSHPAMDHVPSFSRDGKWIYFSSNRTGQFQVWKIPASGGDAVQVTRDGGCVSLRVAGWSLPVLQSVCGGWRVEPLWRVPTSGGLPVKVLAKLLLQLRGAQRGIYYIDELSG